MVNSVLSRQGKAYFSVSWTTRNAPAVSPAAGAFFSVLGAFPVMQRTTIIHNVSDEPLTVEQSDGSQIIVPPRGKRPAELPSEVDSLIPPAQPHGPAASP